MVETAGSGGASVLPSTQTRARRGSHQHRRGSSTSGPCDPVRHRALQPRAAQAGGDPRGANRRRAQAVCKPRHARPPPGVRAGSFGSRAGQGEFARGCGAAFRQREPRGRPWPRRRTFCGRPGDCSGSAHARAGDCSGSAHARPRDCSGSAHTRPGDCSGSAHARPLDDRAVSRGSAHARSRCCRAASCRSTSAPRARAPDASRAGGSGHACADSAGRTAGSRDPHSRSDRTPFPAEAAGDRVRGGGDGRRALSLPSLTRGRSPAGAHPGRAPARGGRGVLA